jgi:hypothetical protein
VSGNHSGRANLIPGGNPGGRPKTKPLTDRLRWNLARSLEDCPELVELVEEQLGGPVPAQWFGRTVGEILADLELAAALAGDAMARGRIWDRIEGKVETRVPVEGLTILLNTGVMMGRVAGEAPGAIEDGRGGLFIEGPAMCAEAEADG